MWSEQSTEQDTTSALSLESAIIGSENRLLTTKNAVFSRESEDSTKLLTHLSDPAVIGVSLNSVDACRLRRIEPKPAESGKSGNEGEKLVKAACKENTSRRLLGGTPTRRGVKACLVCKNRIGFRARQCKHCSALTKGRPKTTTSQRIMEPKVERRGESDMIVDLLVFV